MSRAPGLKSVSFSSMLHLRRMRSFYRHQCLRCPPQIIVVGAGPSGLLLTLLLANRGIPVTLIDKQSDLDTNPRATHYGSPAVYELNRAGVGDELRARGFVPSGVSWRNLNGDILGSLDAEVLADDPDRMVCLPLDQLGKLLKEHVVRQDNATLRFDQNVISIGQSDQEAWVIVDTPEGQQTLKADYIVGCDGANSQIRRSLFGDWEFPGTTWDLQIVATNVRKPRTGSPIPSLATADCV